MTSRNAFANRWAKILAICLPFLLVVAFYAVLSSQGPTPFSYKGDMHILAAPLARFAAENWVSLKVPLLDWNLGDGLNPWLSGQSSVVYPIYPISLLIAKGMGDPGLLLEVTAFLDYLLLAYVLMGSPFFRKWTIAQRSMVVLLFLVQPSGLILGQNWCYFLNSYIWLIITLHWLMAWGRWPSRTRYAWLSLGSTLILYSAINVQMFAFAVVLTALPAVLALRDRIPWHRAAVFGGLAAMILLPSMALLWDASNHSNPAWMRGRETADAALAFAQPLSVFLNGAILGNYFASPFAVWYGVSWRTVGIFWIAPVLPWALAEIPPAHRRPLLWGLLLLGLLMGIASFPFLKWLFLGPFARFRWTWKFAIFLPGLLLAALALRSSSRPGFRASLLLAGSVLAGVGICLRGLQADFMPALRPIASIGAVGLVHPGEELSKVLALKPGERIVPVGRMTTLADQVPMAWLAYAGNGPSLFGVPTLAIYEPLESERQATYRGGLSIPWREALPDDLTLDAFRVVDGYLGPKGASHYLFKVRPNFSGPTIREIHLHDGETLWVVHSESWQPWVQNARGTAGPNAASDGRWLLPKEDGPWRIATSREFSTNTGSITSGETWIPAGTELTPRPLGKAGPWVGAWYLSLMTTFLILWIASPTFRKSMGLTHPSDLWNRLLSRNLSTWGLALTTAASAGIALRILVVLCF